MWRIPVGTQIPVEVQDSTPRMVDLKTVFGAFPAAANTDIAQLNKPGSTYRIHAINLLGTNADPTQRELNLALLRGPGGAGTVTFFDVRTSITASKDFNVVYLDGGPGVMTSVPVAGGIDYYAMPGPNFRFGSDIRCVIAASAGLSGTYSVLYEEYVI